jgi:hypothetical protein
MTDETDKKLGYPTNCWNCGLPLPVFTYACGLCGADNTPLDVRSAETPGSGEAPKDQTAREKLKADLARQRQKMRDALKRK